MADSTNFQQQNVTGDQSMTPLVQPQGAGNVGQTLLQQLGPAMQGTIGYATQNPAMQQQAMEQQRMIDKMALMRPAQMAHAEISDAIARSDPQKASAIYRQALQQGLGILDPTLMAYGDKITELARKNAIATGTADVLEDKANLTSPGGTPVSQTAPGAAQAQQPAQAVAGQAPAEGTVATEPTPLVQPSRPDKYQRRLAALLRLQVPAGEAEKMVDAEYKRDTSGWELVNKPGMPTMRVNKFTGQSESLPGTQEIPKPTFTSAEQTGMAASGVDEAGFALKLMDPNPVVRARASLDRAAYEEKGRELEASKPSPEQKMILGLMGRKNLEGMQPADWKQYYRLQQQEAANKIALESAARIRETRAAKADDPLTAHMPGMVGGLVADRNTGQFLSADEVKMAQTWDKDFGKNYKLVKPTDALTVKRIMLAREVLDQVQPNIEAAAAANDKLPIGQAIATKVRGMAGYQSPDVFFKATNLPIVAIAREMQGRVSQAELNTLTEALGTNPQDQTGRIRDKLRLIRGILDKSLDMEAGTQPMAVRTFKDAPSGYDNVWVNGKQYWRSQSDPRIVREPK